MQIGFTFLVRTFPELILNPSGRNKTIPCSTWNHVYLSYLVLLWVSLKCSWGFVSDLEFCSPQNSLVKCQFIGSRFYWKYFDLYNTTTLHFHHHLDKIKYKCTQLVLYLKRVYQDVPCMRIFVDLHNVSMTSK